MRELTQATVSFLWAMSLFGVQQLTDVLTSAGTRVSSGTGATAFDAVIQTTTNQLSDLLQVTFQAGDQLQRRFVDLLGNVLSLVSLEIFTPSNVSQLSAQTLQQIADTLRVLIPGQNSIAAGQEFMNKLQVYFLVQNVQSALQLSAGAEIDVSTSTQKAYALGDHPALWAVEGLGHLYGNSFFERHEVPHHLLTDAAAQELPAKSLLMLHAGLGLSFAQNLLPCVSLQSPASAVRHVLQQFVTLCRDNARTGYVGASYESLGLVARTFHPRLLYILDQHLSVVAPEVVGYYWHGVGRALYFFPTFFIPGSCSPWQAVEREAPHDVAYYNMLAGLAWAVTLVNLRQPNIVAVLLKYHGQHLSGNDAFANGLMSSLMMRYDTTPDTSSLAAFCHYHPDTDHTGLETLWRSQVVAPCQVALQQYYPILKEHNHLDEIFRHQSLAHLVDQLQREPMAYTNQGG